MFDVLIVVNIVFYWFDVDCDVICVVVCVVCFDVCIDVLLGGYDCVCGCDVCLFGGEL